MIRKIFILLLALALFAVPRAAEAETLGMSVPVFVAHMGIAFERVKWGFAPEEIRERLVRTDDGNYAAEYSPEIFLYLYVEEGDDNINYIALSFTVNAEASLKFVDGESQYESLCRQLILALENGVTEAAATEILTELGLFGPVFDGAQRVERRDRYTYMTRYYDSSIMLLIVPAQ